MSRHTQVLGNGTRDLSRRQFIAATLAGAGTLAAHAHVASGQAAASACPATQIVTLGRTGIKASRLAQGTGWNGS